MAQEGNQRQSGKRPAIEWIAGALGLLITIGLVSFIGWQALQDSPERPQVEVAVTRVALSGDSYLVEIAAFNRGSRTVAGLNVEGTLSIDGQQPEQSSTTFDYVPGHSQTRGGLYFNSDPASGNLQVRPTGYKLP